MKDGTLYREHWVRGSRFIDENEYNRRVREDMKSSPARGKPVMIGGCLLPVQSEPEHIFIIGKPGVGKSVLIYGIVEQIISNSGKAVVYDFKGDFLSKFYSRGKDIIFNPLDSRSVKWNIIGEIKAHAPAGVKRSAAADSICHSLIPPGTDAGNERFFRDGARAVLKALIEFLLCGCSEREQNNAGLIGLLCGSEREIYEKVFSVNPIAANYISGAGSSQSAGVLAVLSQFTESLLCMNYPDGDFTVSGWTADGEPGILYVTGFADIRDMLRPLLSLLIDTIAKNVLSLPDSLTKRIFFMLDEFPTLQRLNSLVELLTLSRSKGGSVWLAAQDLSQVENIYGPLKNTIVNACGTKVLFAVADPHDAGEFSDLISEAEYLVETVQDSGVAGSGGGLSDSDGLNRNYNRQLVTKHVVLPSNIMNMPKFNFIFRSYPYSFVKSKVNPRFDYRDINERLAPLGGEGEG